MKNQKLYSANWHLHLGLLTIYGLLFYMVYTIITTINHGFDFTDEGYYLLSIQNNYNPAYALPQWYIIFRNIFGFLGLDIITVRWIRLVLTIATSLIFSSSLWFIYRQLNHKKATPLNFLLTAGLVTIGSLMCYCWLPQSPSYNDLTQYIVFTSISFSIASTFSKPPFKHPFVPIILAFVAGFIASVVSITKLSVTPMLFVILIVIVLVFAYLNRIAKSRKWMIICGLLCGMGFSTSLILIYPQTRQFFTNLPMTLMFYQNISSGYDSQSLMQGMYIALESAAHMLLLATVSFFIYFILNRLIKKWISDHLLVGATSIFLLTLIFYIIITGHIPTGRINLILPIAFISFFAMVSIIKANWKQNKLIIIGFSLFLILAPLLFTFGTNRMLMMAAFSYLGFWFFPVGLFSHQFSKSSYLVVLAFLLLASLTRFNEAYTNYAYRQPPREKQNTLFAYRNSSIQIDEARAAYLSRLRTSLGKAGFKKGDYILGFYKIPGIVYLMEGQALGGFIWDNKLDRIFCANVSAEDINPQKGLFIIQIEPPSDETKYWLKKEGINLDFFQITDSIQTPPEAQFKNKWTYIYRQ